MDHGGFDPAAVDAQDAARLRASGSLKWSLAGGQLGAWVAEMDFGCAPVITEELRRLMAGAGFGYLTEGLTERLAEACAGWQRERYGWQVAASRVRPLADVLTGLEVAIDVFGAPGGDDGPVVLPTPAYMPFLDVPGQKGRRLVQVPMMTPTDGAGAPPRHDLAALDRALADGGLLVLVNPANPVGRVFTEAELREIAEVVERNGARVFADEIHAPLVYPGYRHVPYASLSEATARHTLTAVSASKGWNLAGLKCAQLVLGSEEDAARYDAKARLAVTHGASTPGVVASIAAYTRGAGWLDAAVDYLDGNRRRLGELLAERLPAARWSAPQGTYLAWIDLRPLAEAGTPLRERPAELLAEKAGVRVVDGTACGEAGRGFVRLNFATPRPVLEEMVDRIAAAVAVA